MRGMPPEPIPVVLCGDFNSTPEQGVISLLSAGKLPANHIDMERVSSSHTALQTAPLHGNSGCH